MPINYAEKKKSLRQKVFELLSDMRWHSYLELLHAGGTRYNTRIVELQNRGFQIESRPLSNTEVSGNEYRLMSMAKGEPKERRVRVFFSLEDAQLIADCEAIPDEIRNNVQNAVDVYIARKDMV